MQTESALAVDTLGLPLTPERLLDIQAQGSLRFDPEEEEYRDDDGGKEDIRASVISGVDTPPILEASEEVLDPMTLAIEGFVVSVLG